MGVEHVNEQGNVYVMHVLWIWQYISIKETWPKLRLTFYSKRWLIMGVEHVLKHTMYVMQARCQLN